MLKKADGMWGNKAYDEYDEVLKDPANKNYFRITRPNSPSMMLAALNNEQYELWYNAFRRVRAQVASELGR